MAEKKRYALLDVLRVAAILLVLNSHFDPLYPISALATGGAVVTSQYLGAKEPDNAKRSAGQLVLMASVFGVAIMALCLVFAGNLIDLFFGTIRETSILFVNSRSFCIRVTSLSKLSSV